MTPRDAISAAIRSPKAKGAPALVAYLTAGYPTREAFLDHLRETAEIADVVEIGVPFSDPMADGIMIQRTSQVALTQGASLSWILDALKGLPRFDTPLLLMSYVNPLLAYGYDKLAAAAAEAGIAGFIVPDMPLEECDEFAKLLEPRGLAFVQFASPLTPDKRLEKIAARSSGFTYAVTTTGTTGQDLDISPDTLAYLARVRRLSTAPVCAGFGIRSAEHVKRLAPHVDGVIVGSALLAAIERGETPGAFLRGLRP